MDVRVFDGKAAASKAAFNVIKDAMGNGIQTLGLATGSSPVDLYNDMTSSDLDFSKMTSVNLDEYVGLDTKNDQSYHYFMNEHLFSKKPFKQSFVPDGQAADIEQAAKDYDQIIEEHPIDIQLLGIGRNGHIGFNEPGTPFDEGTHKVTLTQSTIDANARFFEHEEDVPRYAISMGIGSIMKSKQIILLAFGEDKADAIKATVEGPVTEDVPASVLQNHDNVIVFVDEAAASKLSK
ncbi:glucosamine-6-phosphate deaminase [Lacticaseibacillus pantheris]|jgi:glucosamine-6-phosphate deaminase|uniref:Glucosamine-6-phosphate deaminase n=1 Tax=Lacticaseibacillus pantheris DSM 15945 = JCM 12539 = NBRC 106106 TaxID=1423783 RepID=A0A0R1U4G6_9LACO|nr:glucosamine-6-phosphate deaminase [Lacticaseibacillus pantheris]KRL88140.1 Glucosamine-6-phosphate isomerase [Lacticaseibacillus pantheris DSM 15945 = JCM 12539 = NBRC 106106]WKF83891.1 glucosamine-6-phosphate deaminase [Lacticaseibacillus pantheris]